MDGLLKHILPRAWRAMLPAILLALLFTAACSNNPPFTLEASGPYVYLVEYPTAVNPPLERVAIMVTITNRAGDDLSVSPADFVARDAERRIYPANPTATASDARSVRLAMRTQGGRDLPPLGIVTLRQGDIMSGSVVFDVPTGVRPVDLIWRQADGDSVVTISPGR